MVLGRCRHRCGFSALSLVVIVAIILFLLALLIPAVARVRQAAERTQSVNNLKQLSIAMHACNDVYRKLPPIAGKFGAAKVASTLHFHLLPFVEQDNLYKQGLGDYTKACGVSLPVFLDQNDKSAPGHQYQGFATTNYAGNWMVFKEGEANIPQTFLDGTSNTMVFAERYQVCGEHPCAWGYAALYYWAPMFAYYSHAKFQNNPSQAECDPARPQSIGSDRIQIALGDGSVRSIAHAISPRTWWFACDPADGNALGDDFND